MSPIVTTFGVVIVASCPKHKILSNSYFFNMQDQLLPSRIFFSLPNTTPGSTALRETYAEKLAKIAALERSRQKEIDVIAGKVKEKKEGDDPSTSQGAAAAEPEMPHAPQSAMTWAPAFPLYPKESFK